MRKKSSLPVVVCALAAGMAGGCATIVEGSDQTITVSTDPTGAVCELTRAGQLLGVVNPTPGSLTVEKGSDNIMVACTKEGHEEAVGTLASEFEDMTFGNVLFGGIIGVGVDAASGALNEYPPSIRITLPELEDDEPASTDLPDGAPSDELNQSDDPPIS